MRLPWSTAEATSSVRPICTCTLSMVTVAMSTRMPIASAMPPSDMMLIVLPVTQSPNNDPSRASGMVITTTITLLRSRRNRRIISPVKPAPISTLGGHALHRRHHGRRLVKLEADRDVLGDGVAEQLHRLADVGHDGQRRTCILLDDRQIHRLLAVDKRISVGDIGIILDARHVAEVDVQSDLERDIAKALDVHDRRIVGDHGHRVLDVDVPAGMMVFPFARASMTCCGVRL